MGRLRIIAGLLKGRRIPVPNGLALRPTADRVREALFSILGPRLAAARVLDAYAGSGALGFEALSRGADRVVFLESDRRAAEALRSTARDLGLAPNCTIVEGEVVRVLGRSSAEGPFDLIFADPPYDRREEPGIFLPRAAGLLEREGLLVLERPTVAEVVDCPSLELTRSARYGNCRLDFYRLAQV